MPVKKVVLPKEELAVLYEHNSASAIAKLLGISKYPVLRNLHEYGILTPTQTKWNKGLTKETDKRLLRISQKLSGIKSYRYNSEIHSGKIIECACGCGKTLFKHDKKGRSRDYIRGHNTRIRDSEAIKQGLTRRAPNREEGFLLELFRENGLPYRYVGNGEVILGGKNPDFINVNGGKKIIEFFGEHWHNAEDAETKREIYQRYGFSMLAIWGKDLANKNKRDLLAKILAFTQKT